MRVSVVSAAFAVLFVIGADAMAQEATFSVKRNDAGRHVLSIMVNHSIPIRGGSLNLTVDSTLFRLGSVSRGADLSADAITFSNSSPVDSTGSTVPGGLILGWVNRIDEQVNDILEAGDHEVFVVEFEPTGECEGTCASVRFVEGLRSAAGSPPLLNSVADLSATTVFAVTENSEICCCDPEMPTAVTTDALPPAEVGAEYAGQLESTGGLQPVAWRLVSGDLPPGLELNLATGAITGTPDTEGDFEFSVEACDSCSDLPDCVVKALTISVAPRAASAAIASLAKGKAKMKKGFWALSVNKATFNLGESLPAASADDLGITVFIGQDRVPFFGSAVPSAKIDKKTGTIKKIQIKDGKDKFQLDMKKNAVKLKIGGIAPADFDPFDVVIEISLVAGEIFSVGTLTPESVVGGKNEDKVTLLP